MKMKKRLPHSLLLPLLLTAACEDAGPLPVLDQEAPVAHLRIRVRNTDREPGAFQLLSFDPRGPQTLDTYYYSDSVDNAGDIAIGTGERIVAAVINGPDLSAVADLSTLLQWRYVPGETDEPDASPLLFGCKEEILSEGTRELSLDVHHQTGRIVVLQIRNRLDGAQTIDGIYLFLANAAEDNLLGTDWLESAVRLHPDGHTGTDESAFSSRPWVDGQEGRTATHPEWTALQLGPLPFGSIHTGPYPFYSCPTPPDWQPWLVLAARISGRVWYYNVPLSSIRKDLSQEVSITLRTLGADQPCVENLPGSYELVRAVSDWTVLPSTETI